MTLHLHRKYGCKLQMGGNDQWSNIISGADLIRRVEGGSAYGMTFTLLTTGEGIKCRKPKPVHFGLIRKRWHLTIFINIGGM